MVIIDGFYERCIVESRQKITARLYVGFKIKEVFQESDILIIKYISEYGQASKNEIVNLLKDKALSNGGLDNITV